MSLWVTFVVMCLIALAFLVWPLYRRSRRLTATITIVVAATAALSAVLYHNLGQPGVPSGASAAPDVNAMVASLEQRLDSSPEDVNGWLMLGRSYQTLGRLDESVVAFQRALDLEGGQNSQTLASLAIVILEQNDGNLNERSAGLFENALAIDPNNANALFYGGIAAAQRGNVALAADRWEILMGLNAPDEIKTMLQRKIGEWRGEPPPAVVASDGLAIRVTIGEAVDTDLPGSATVFVIARDPAQPAPPVAVKSLTVQELPAVVQMGDADAMMPGRVLSAFDDIEVVARVSLSGTAMAQSGDWYGAVTTSTATSSEVAVVIDQETP